MGDFGDHSKSDTTVVTKEVEVTNSQSVSSDHEGEFRKRVFKIKSESPLFSSLASQRSVADLLFLAASDLLEQHRGLGYQRYLQSLCLPWDNCLSLFSPTESPALNGLT